MGTLAGGGWVSLADSIPILSTLVGIVGGAIGFYFGGDIHHNHLPPQSGPGNGSGP